MGIFNSDHDTHRPLNLESFFSTTSFHQVECLILDHEDVPGVFEEREKLKQRLLAFDAERTELLESLQPACNAAHEKLMAAASKRKRMKKLLIGSIAAQAFLIIFADSILAITRASLVLTLVWAIVQIAVIFALPLGGILTLYTTFKLNRAADENSKTKQEAIARISEVNHSYEAKNAQARLRIDSMYLGSLSAEERQLILIRREQARQHQALMDQQRAHQARLEEQQQQVARATQELLEIERERERRLRGY